MDETDPAVELNKFLNVSLTWNDCWLAFPPCIGKCCKAYGSAVGLSLSPGLYILLPSLIFIKLCKTQVANNMLSSFSGAAWILRLYILNFFDNIPNVFSTTLLPLQCR